MKRISILLALMTVLFALNASAYSLTLYNGETVHSTISVTEGTRDTTLPVPAAPSGTRFMGWRNADGTKIYRTTFISDGTTELYAYFDKASTPVLGSNMIPDGGFDGDTLGVFVSNGTASLVKDGNNGALYYDRISHHASIQWPVEWEAGRKYYLSYKIKSVFDNMQTCHNYRYYTASNTSTNDHALYEHHFDANEWHQVEYDYTIPADYVPTNTIDALSLFGNSTKSLENGTAVVRPVYYDDVVLIPYHKITYDANGGSVDTDVKWAKNGTYTVESITPVRKNYNFVGWGLTELAETPVKSVELSGKDITLYAIWEQSESFSEIEYTFANNNKGDATGTIAVYGTDETASHTDVKLYYADKNGKLDGFTQFASLKTGEDGSAVFNVTGARVFPVGATKICAEFTGSGLDTVRYWYDIPENKQSDSSGTPKYRFYAASDLHEGETWGNMPSNRANFARDIAENKDSLDFIIMNGDLVNHGTTAELTAYETYVKENIHSNNIPYFPVNGNHEFHTLGSSGDVQNGTHNEELYLRIQADNEKYLKDNFGIVTERGEGKWFYSTEYEGLKLIFLSTPTSLGASGISYSVSEEQLIWLTEELYESEKSNETVFVMSHVQPGTLSNYTALKAILDKHPNLFLITAHSHQNLALESEENLQAGDMKTTYTHFNDGSVGYVRDETKTIFQEYGVCFLVEVYEDKVLVIGKQFANDRTYTVAHKYYSIALPDTDKEIGTVTMSKTNPQIGDTVKALVDGNTPAQDAVCQWYVGDKLLHTGTEYTVAATEGMAGKRLITRVTFADGTFASAVSESAFDGIDIVYDLNGGEGTVPNVQKVLDGQEFTPYVDTYVPHKDGEFFIGWSTDKNATVPMAKVTAQEGIVLYAVYSDKPEFHFTANYSGLRPNGYVAESEIKDGKLCFTSSDAGADCQFEISGVKINADEYVYLRVKMTEYSFYDCVYFATENAAYSWANTRIPYGADKKIPAGDMVIYECYIPDMESSKDNWKGTVKSFRFDPFDRKSTSAEVDYIVFADKKGVYGAEITVSENGSVTLSDDTENCKVGTVSQDGKTLTITLKPDSGYEFTTAEDVMYFVTVNGAAPKSADVVNDCAVVTYDIPWYVEPDDVTMGEITLLDASYNAIDSIPDSAFYAQVPVTNNLLNESFTVVIASYDADGRMLDTDFLYADPDKGKTVTFGAQVSNKDGKVAEVRAFAFSNLLDMSPLCESVNITK